MRRRMKSERGAVIVEFALVVPILIVLVVGIAEFGRAFFIQSTISGAAREGVRMLALADPPGSGTSDAKTAAKNAAAGLGLSDGQISADACPATPTSTDQAKVTITYTTSSFTGMFGNFTLTGKGVMRCNG